MARTSEGGARGTLNDKIGNLRIRVFYIPDCNPGPERIR